ncbi:transcriptional antiterminator, BglG family [Corynebacterium kutscheri]|uniref:Transcriptional antiterminator, BglG family n=1 Tax=Corynebacterium kutscheri TaxID=35755 RepID=A0A0F6R1A7_9CORY|nr:PRD domain-containing protein [Corynebacterium kutscheri]AKE42217.1 transcriptional antiterminator, BglG family [Corynebacterium kutscheri]VEH10560.1 beta-glucoside operon antiterminator [Corynebacterium kutscheri]
MKIVRVLNNNVVLAIDEHHQEAVLTGWGVGFQKKPGELVDKQKINRVFRPEADRDSDNLADQLAHINPLFLAAADDALKKVAATLDIPATSASVIALADHLDVAQQRYQAGDTSVHPLHAEVVHLYATEYQAAQNILREVNTQLSLQLPEEEAIAIALHLVNAGFRTDSLLETYRMTGIFQQLFKIISASFGIEVNQHSISAARFITHLRYFFVRVNQNKQLNEGMHVLQDSMELTHPEAVRCAAKLAAVLELRLGAEVSADELAYLSLHVARLVQENGNSSH